MDKQEMASRVERIMQHVEDKDLCMISAPHEANPEESVMVDGWARIKDCFENDLKKRAGYRGYIQMKETDGVQDTFLVVNYGGNFAQFFGVMTGMQKTYAGPGILIWDHTEKRALLTNADGEIVETYPAFSVELLCQSYEKLHGRALEVAEYVDDPEQSFRFNYGGNWVTAMGIETSRNRFIKRAQSLPTEE